jgi:hypothetical protein
MAPGALPRPGRVPEQRLLSPKIWLRRRRRCGTVLEISPTPLAAPTWCEAGPWPPSSSLLVLRKLPGKIGVLELVSSNSENISCVAFLKHKNSREQGTGTVASCQ